MLTVGLFNKKSNLGPIRRPVGLEITWGDDRIDVQRVDPANVGDLADKMPLWMRMKQAVKHGPQTLAALAVDLDSNAETLDRYVRRYNKTFTRVPGADGITRISLLAAERAS